MRLLFKRYINSNSGWCHRRDAVVEPWSSGGRDVGGLRPSTSARTTSVGRGRPREIHGFAAQRRSSTAAGEQGSVR